MEATQAGTPDHNCTGTNTHSFKASESAAAHAQSPSLRQFVEWPCLLGCRLKTHCYGDGAWALSKEAEMTYREVHPSWMAMRGAQPPNNTRAWSASGPFNLREIVACGRLRGYFSRHRTMKGNRSPSIGLFQFYVTCLSKKVLRCKTWMHTPEEKQENTHLHADVNTVSFVAVLRPRLHTGGSQKMWILYRSNLTQKVIRLDISLITHEVKYVKTFLVLILMIMAYSSW